MTKGHPHSALWWSVFWILAALVAVSGALVPLDRSIGAVLSRFGNRVPASNLIWVVGGIPITGLAVLGAAWRRNRWRLVLAFLGGLLVEALAKHFIATPLPKATFEPPFYRHLETFTNITPKMVLSWVAVVIPMHGASAKAHVALFRGSFPSGHVFRLTYASGAWLFRRRRWTWAIALVAGTLVVATGGHWALDAAGGFLLARALLAFVDSVSRGQSEPRGARSSRSNFRDREEAQHRSR